MSVVTAIRRQGQVISGRGQGTALFSGLPELRKHFGADPFPGTLNVILNRPIWFKPERAVIRLNFCHRLLWRATLDGVWCLFHRWRECPLHVIELISIHQFGVKKGQDITVAFDAADVQPIPWRRLLGWHYLWFGRRRFHYADDAYSHWAAKVAAGAPVYCGQQDLWDDP
jgi:hypothetical protein